jgi:preprotein translocase subunit SecG
LDELLEDLDTISGGRQNALSYAVILSVFIQHRLHRELQDKQNEFQKEQLAQAVWLTRATWALAIVTIILAIVTACN